MIKTMGLGLSTDRMSEQDSDVVPCVQKAFGTGGFRITRKRNGCFVLTGELALPVLLV